jgi:vanillate O-demethylase monooxygenase subunit
MFLKNYWYVAAREQDIGREPFARTLLGEPVVLYRTAGGAPVAFEDRCCHRSAPLSLGRVVGDNLQCGYHGMTFDPAGKCVAIPGQTTIPEAAKVRVYPVCERWRFIWIWMGDPALADEDEIPEVRVNTDPDWAFVGGYMRFDCHYQLLVDNLLDLTHETFLHQKTIGNEHVAATPLAKVAGNNKKALAGSPLKDLVSDKRSVTATRWMLDIDLPPLYAATGGFGERKEKVDRWQLLHFEPPSHVWLDAGVASAGTGAPQGDRSKGITHILYDGITPETDDSTHYFWSFPRDYRIDEAEVTEFLDKGLYSTFLEDKDMLERQHALMRANPEALQIDINVDAPAVQARRLVDRLLAAQAKAADGGEAAGSAA